MSSPITVAVIGGGLIGPRHAQSIINNPHTTLIALVDPAPHGSQTAASLKTAHYNSIAALLASPHKPQAALVCTPNHTHVALATELASAGVHILVEKPLSTTIPSGLSLIAHAKAHNVHLLAGHHRRFNPYIVATKALLTAPSPPLGRVLAISGLWTLFKPPPYYNPPTEWRRGADGGVVLINMIHEIDILQHLVGPITTIHAEATHKTRNFDATEGAAIIFRFESGVVGSFVVCDATPSPFNFEAGTGENPTIPKAGKDFYRIFGTEGTLSVPDMTVYSYAEGKKSWTEVIGEHQVEVMPVVPFDAQIEHFRQLVAGEVHTPMCSGEEALSALVVAEGIRIATETGAVVDVKALLEKYKDSAAKL